MTPHSARALMWFACALLLLASVVLSPVAALAVSALAAVCTLPALVLDKGWRRVGAALLVIGSLLLVASHYEQGAEQLGAYRQRASKAPAFTPSASVRP